MYKPLDNSFYLIDPADKMNASMYEPQVNSFYLIDPADKMNGSMYFF
jgi:hypothetical protein